MTTNKNSRIVLAKPRHGLTRLRLALALATLVWWGLARIASAQVTGQIVQQFFVPFPETDFKTSLQAIAAGNRPVARSDQHPNGRFHRGGDEQYHHRL